MPPPRRLLLPAIFILGLGCYLIIGGKGIDPAEWPMLLGLVCVVLAVCAAAAIEGLHGLHQRVAELERRLSATRPPADPDAGAGGP